MQPRNRSLADVYRVRSLAETLVEDGFVAEISAPQLKISEPYKMSEMDVNAILADIPESKGNERVVVHQVLDLKANGDKFAADIRAARSLQFNSQLGVNPITKTTLLYPVYDGKSHYEYLKVTVTNEGVDLYLENSLKKPPTKNTATYTVMAAADTIVKTVLRADAKGAADVKRIDDKAVREPHFAGDQLASDATSCSFLTIKKIARDSKAQAVNELATANSIGALKVAAAKRLLAKSQRTAALANQVAFDVATGTLYLTNQTAMQRTRFDQYKALVLQHKRQQELSQTVAGTLVPNASGFRKLFSRDATRNATVLNTVYQEYVALAAVMTQTDQSIRQKAVPDFKFDETALKLYADQNQLQRYATALDRKLRTLNQANSSQVQARATDTQDILRENKRDLLQLLVQSTRAADLVRLEMKKPVSGSLTQAEKTAYETLKANKRTNPEANKKLAAIHQQMILEGKSFAEAPVRQDAKVAAQIAEDAKLARILQNQEVITFFKQQKKPNTAQIAADEKVARALDAKLNAPNASSRKRRS